MITLVKLGGSLITDKNISRYFRQDTMASIAHEIKDLMNNLSPDNRLIIGHGSGSFGHIEAKKYDTIQGVSSSEEWLGFSKVAYVASELSYLVATEFINAGLPIMRFQPSATVISESGVIQSMDTQIIVTAIKRGLIPLLHGDVAFDKTLGGTIVSTEAIFTYLVKVLDVRRIILLGEVDGVLDAGNHVIANITPQSFEKFKSILRGSDGVDVTGGMYQKVNEMLQLVQQKPDLEIIIANGRNLNVLTDLLCTDIAHGTKISSN